MFNEQNVLCGWQDIKKNEKIISRDDVDLRPFAFNGIHILNPEVITLFPEEKVFSVIKAYLKVAETEDIQSYVCDNLKWIDVGKLDSLTNAALLVKSLGL